MKHLASRKNPLVKYVKSLLQRKFRDREGKFIIEGVRLLEESIKATQNKKTPFFLETVFFTLESIKNERTQKLIQSLWEIGVRVYTVSPEVMEYLANTITPQGVIGIVSTRSKVVPAVDLFYKKETVKEAPLILVLDRIQDPGNLGTLLRTAEAAGVSEVWLIKGTTDPFSPKVVRASMGSIFRVPIFSGVEYTQVLDLQKAGFTLVAAVVEGFKPYYMVDFNKPTAILLGNEASGLAECLKMDSEENITISLAGNVESLNAAVAGAIILFEARRQRNQIT